MLWLTVIVFVVLLLALVLVHEAGHFLAARRAGSRVEEFAFGFPPRLFSRQRGETTYSFNLLPIGGYVKIEGEDMEETTPGPRSFASKSAGWRIIILAAGVAMNVVMAAVLLSVQAGVGIPTVETEENAGSLTALKTYILNVSPDSPAAAAGITPLDRIVRLENVADPSLEDVHRITSEAAGREVTLEIERTGRHELITIAPRVNPPEGQGALGITLVASGLERVPWWQAPLTGVRRTGDMLYAIMGQFASIIHRLVSEGSLGDTVTGPIGIAVYTNEVTNLGISYILEFGALISLNLALINILPLPALDGGRILFVVIEKILGRRVPGKVEQIAHTTGFALLILLMLVITFRDIQRFF